MSRRWLAPEAAGDLGRLDPEAIARVRGEAWPEAANADELHDALVWLGFLTRRRSAGGARLGAAGSQSWRGEKRVALLHAPAATLWIAAERAAAVPGAVARGEARARDRRAGRPWRAAMVARRGAGRDPARPARRQRAGDRRCAGGAARACARSDIAAALAALEAEGFAMRGRFTPAADGRRMVRAPPARPHPPLHGQAAARRDRAGGGARLPALPARLAARRRRGADGGAGGGRGGRRPARRLRGAGRRLGDRDPAGAPRRLRAGLARRSLPRRTHRLGAAAGRATAAPDGSERRWRRCGRRRSRCWRAGMPRCGRRCRRRRTPARPRVPGRRPSPIALREHGASFFDELVDGDRPAAPAGRRGAGRAGRPRPGHLRQLRRAARAAGAVRPAPDRAAARRGADAAAFGMEDAGRWALARRPRPTQAAACQRRRQRPSSTWRARCCAATASCSGACSSARPPGCRRGATCCASTAGSRRAARSAAAASSPASPANSSRCRTRSACCARFAAGRPRAPASRVSGADPLNLAGILTPGPKLAALTGNRLLYRDGLPVAMLAGGEMQFLETLEGSSRWEARRKAAAALGCLGAVAEPADKRAVDAA